MTLTSSPKSRLRLPPNKHQVKQELAQDVANFLARGGNVEHVEQGETALVNGCFNQQRPVIATQAQTRTLLSSQIEAIEKRKEERRQAKPAPITTNRRPTKKWIYDDFGEPLRWVWA
ncbi:hypothetical protein OAD42_01050 [Oceanospirillaceae bacterium]|jgi:hypothetical protein|nr:hypothetical protein [Oceanospirillaceae bacterium]MDB9957649.1 hypothetical protein [Oceanospirillaceae bacterium]MDC1340188.1 hypothetical protein [Oceanospirillaceae bacterium]|tara:strand:+ start:1573 stop:1923 length:351 start_codon:yes stop_codon:yes gene_type:complete